MGVKLRKYARKAFRISGAIILLLLVVLVALPLWFPWVLQSAAKRFGANYLQYRHEGYGHFQLNHFSFTNDAVRFEAERVKAFVPTAWVWRRFFGPKSEPFLEVGSWRYTSLEGKSEQSSSPYTDFKNVKALGATLRNWLPRADFTNGIIRVQDWVVEIPQARWVEGKLSTQAIFPKSKNTWALLADTESEVLKLNLDSAALDLRSTVSIADTNGKLNVEGTTWWLTNRIEMKAGFSRHDLLPETAGVRAESFSIPARLFKLEQYRDITGSLRAEWSTNRFTLDLAAKAFPQSTNLPAVDIEARASGDTNSAKIDLAKISAPWLQAGLSRPTDFFFRPPFLSQPAALNVVADLGQQPWFSASGKLMGEVIFHPGTNRFPQISFALSGSEVAVSNVVAKALQLNGNFLWPRIELTQGKMLMADGSGIDLAGKFDLEEKVIHDGRLNFSGGFGQQFLPRGMSFHSATLAAQFDGPVQAITHSAKLEVENLLLPHTKPWRVEAEWNGHGLDFQPAQIVVTAGSSTLQIRGAMDLGGEKKLRLAALDLSKSNHTELQLRQPFQVTFRKATGTAFTNFQDGRLGVPDAASPNRMDAERQTAASWMARLDPMFWSGTNRELRMEANVDWPRKGTFNGTAQGLDTALVQEFFGIADSEARVDSLRFSGGWTNGPMAFRLELKAGLKTKEQLSFSANADMTGGADGLSINQLSISSVTQLVSRAQGTLPIVLEPAATNGLVQINPDGPLKLRMLTEPQSILWEKIAAVSGLALQKPNLTADLDGTWSAPHGRVTMQVERIQFPPALRLPAVENVDVLAELDRDTARIPTFDFSVEGQPVSIKGQMPLGQSYWSRLRQEKDLPDWRTATAHLKMENAQLAAFASFLPEILSPLGTATVDVSLEAGGTLRGELSVDGARTRPIDDLGPVRNIQAHAILAGRTVTLTNASAEIGGQRVDAEGNVELNEQVWRTNGLPVFHVRVHGTNVPLARNPSILLRSDFDLAVTNSIFAPPLISGSVTLRDSLLLADLKSLAPEEAASPELRPPFFSVEALPWAAWRLQVNVRGSSSLRVQTPLFHGKVSISMKLEGTLKDPIALGQVKIDSGSVTFPFGNLDVKQGFISLTSENPYHPQLFVIATAQRLGYQIKMEATGPADEPVVLLSSTPPLNSEQIILMLTTGQVPRGVGAAARTGERAQGLGLFVGKSLLSDFGLGGSGDERLTFRSGQEISQSGRPTYELGYKLNDRWSVVGEYDRFDQYNLNLKWNVYSK